MKFKESILFSLPRLFRQTFSAYKRQIAVLTFLSLLNGVLEGIGISTIVPLFSFITKDGAKGTDFISRSIERFFNIFHLTFSLRSLLLFIVALFVAKVVALFATTYITTRVIANYEANVRLALFVRTLRANWSYLSRQKLGHLGQILTTNLSNTSSLFAVFVALVLATAKILIYSIIAINISSVVALITLVIALISFFLFKPLFLRNKILSTKAESLNREMSHFTNENILGMKTVKTFAVEKQVLAKAKNIFHEIRNLIMSVAILRGVTDVLIQTFGIIFIMGVFTFFYKTTAFNFATFAVIVYAINQIFLQVQAAQNQLHRLSSLTPYLSSLQAYQTTALAQKEQTQGTLPFQFRKELVFDNINFSFGKDTPVLRTVSFAVKKYEMVGLIGPSGAGKTTIVDMLLRLYEPNQGVITLDGKPISEIDMTEWRNRIGYVSQDIFLMNDTIANNISFYDTAITAEKIQEAARMANIEDFIAQLPLGYNTIIGERGILLSGGQRQRIILARVLAREPEILILDEATSALDNESETLIQKSIASLRGKVTLISIAHRLSTVASLDRLLVIDKGMIIEEGKPDDLLRSADSYFSKMHTLGKYF